MDKYRLTAMDAAGEMLFTWAMSPLDALAMASAIATTVDELFGVADA